MLVTAAVSPSQGADVNARTRVRVAVLVPLLMAGTVLVPGLVPVAVAVAVRTNDERPACEAPFRPCDPVRVNLRASPSPGTHSAPRASPRVNSPVVTAS
ncbi:hypothetical protein GCM10010350_56580 [Streptomyces galilaeus]|nr:hypothetical protein GCM10010350_56580 [Streptomyces galilaeus]